ncbi:MAG: hypothetical protein LR000_02075 [Candidatus Pacebacteria bacterium]|nr:hypothetical protein [Candidatus Paceibacterota bacterium]
MIKRRHLGDAFYFEGKEIWFKFLVPKLLTKVKSWGSENLCKGLTCSGSNRKINPVKGRGEFGINTTNFFEDGVFSLLIKTSPINNPNRETPLNCTKTALFPSKIEGSFPFCIPKSVFIKGSFRKSFFKYNNGCRHSAKYPIRTKNNNIKAKETILWLIKEMLGKICTTMGEKILAKTLKKISAKYTTIAIGKTTRSPFTRYPRSVLIFTSFIKGAIFYYEIFRIFVKKKF